jgi:hypothetical protein
MLIAYPVLALVPSVVFLLLFMACRRFIVLAAAGAWALYTAYEFAMKARWLCTGECNIRVDLLAIYPLLLVLSSVAALAAFRGLRRRGRARR